MPTVGVIKGHVCALFIGPPGGHSCCHRLIADPRASGCDCGDAQRRLRRSPRGLRWRHGADGCQPRLAPESAVRGSPATLLIGCDVLIALLLPWVHNAARFAVGDVESLPYADALNSLPREQAVALERYAGMFVSGETVSDTIA
jgi:hypothetical protein